MAETVSQILAAVRSGEKPPKNDIQKALGKLRKIERLLDRLMAAARSEDASEGYEDWEQIYSAIFSRDPADILPRTRAALELANFSFPDYCDPDTSYEADVRAWVEAFKRVVEQVEDRATRGNAD